MSPADSGRRNVYIPSPLWERIQQAAADEGSRCGHPVSVSEWLRKAAEAQLPKPTTKP